MPLTPQDIVRKEFREALRGYNQADVDLFLDEVVEEFSRLADENQRMKVRIAALQQEVARLREARGVAASQPMPATGGDAARLENEVRARVRRFLEEQIRQVDASSTAQGNPSSSTAERMAREITAGAEEEADPDPPGTPSREPFWAGE